MEHCHVVVCSKRIVVGDCIFFIWGWVGGRGVRGCRMCGVVRMTCADMCAGIVSAMGGIAILSNRCIVSCLRRFRVRVLKSQRLYHVSLVKSQCLYHVALFVAATILFKDDTTAKKSVQLIKSSSGIAEHEEILCDEPTGNFNNITLEHVNEMKNDTIDG